MHTRSFVMVFGLLITACGDDDDATMDPGASADAAAVEVDSGSEERDAGSVANAQVLFEVDYQTGAEPYTQLGANENAWMLLHTNVEALYSMSEPDLVVPQDLSEMQELTDVTGTSFDVDAILSIAKSHRDMPSGENVEAYYIVFLDGYFADDSGDQPGVLGVSIGNTGVIAMFKPVIESTGVALVPRYVEQTTLIHEFGHAVGLVNNGIPLASEHQDSEHGAHCNNPDCVMYYLNEGAADLVNFVSTAVMSGSTIIFDEACLADAHATL